MPTYYVADDARSFPHDCKPVDTYDAAAAAEYFCSEIFDSGECDIYRPLECIVAEDEHGKAAMKFLVTRTVTITDDARELGPVKIPDDHADA